MQNVGEVGEVWAEWEKEDLRSNPEKNPLSQYRNFIT